MDVNRRETCKAHMYVEYILTYDVISFNEKCKGKGTIIIYMYCTLYEGTIFNDNNIQY